MSNSLSPYQLVEAALESRGCRHSSGGWLCPAHDDSNPSLSFNAGHDGKVVLNCFAGCNKKAICAALGLKVSQLFPEKQRKPKKVYPTTQSAIAYLLRYFKREGRNVVGGQAGWLYQNISGAEAMFCVRFNFEDGSKQFRPIHSVDGGWSIGDPPGKLPLYELPGLIRTDLKTPVIVCEGEKCVDVMRALGFTSTTSSHGAESAIKSDWSPLAGREAVVLPDADEAGTGYAQDVARILLGLTPPAVVRIASWPVTLKMGKGDDVADVVERARTTGDDDDKIRRTIQYVIDEAPAVHPEDLPATDAKVGLAGGPLTDLNNSARLVSEKGDSMRYCFPLGKWLVWAGIRWQPDEVGTITEWGKDLAHAILAEANDSDKERWREARSCQSRAKIEAMVVLARSSVPIMPDRLDRDPFALNVNTGTIDLRTGKLRPHSREDLNTKLAPVNYDASATCPVWQGFIERILPDADVRAFLQRAVGYSLTGAVYEQAVFVLWGTGANGKSTLVEVLLTLLGDYAKTVADTLLIADERGDRHPTEKATLCGLRFASASETEEGKRLAESKVKQLTGGDTITARFMRQDEFTFPPTHKIWLATNHKPEIRGTDEGIWRRIMLIPFDVRIPSADQDKSLPAKLRAELPGILNWALKGCAEWQRYGLDPSQVVLSATDGYRVEMDQVGQFLAERCIIDKAVSTEVSILYQVYQSWCDKSGEPPVIKRAFCRRLKERGFKTKAGAHNVTRMCEIGLLTQVEKGKEDVKEWSH